MTSHYCSYQKIDAYITWKFISRKCVKHFDGSMIRLSRRRSEWWLMKDQWEATVGKIIDVINLKNELVKWLKIDGEGATSHRKRNNKKKKQVKGTSAVPKVAASEVEINEKRDRKKIRGVVNTRFWITPPLDQAIQCVQLSLLRATRPAARGEKLIHVAVAEASSPSCTLDRSWLQCCCAPSSAAVIHPPSRHLWLAILFFFSFFLYVTNYARMCGWRLLNL